MFISTYMEGLMSSKNTAEVILGGKVIKLGGYESEGIFRELHHTLITR